MEWIKKILEKHKKEDGTVNLDDALKEINAEFPKNAIPKDKFNDLSGQLKTANETIDDLKKGNTDNETLQNTIKQHEETIKTLKADTARKDKEMAITSAFKEAGATDIEYLIFKSGGVDKFELDSDGKIKELDNLVKAAKEHNPTFFKAEDPKKDKKILDNKLTGGDLDDSESDVAAMFKNSLNGF